LTAQSAAFNESVYRSTDVSDFVIRMKRRWAAMAMKMVGNNQ